MEDGGWKMDDGRWRMESLIVFYTLILFNLADGHKRTFKTSTPD